MVVPEFFGEPFCQRLALTLLHFVWQGFLIAGLAALLIRVLRIRRPRTGYVLYLAALVLAACVALAVGTCRRATWAWSAGMTLTLAAALSSILTVLRYDLAELMALMQLPEEQVSMVAAFGIADGWPMVLINAVVWGTFVAYLMTLRRFFAISPAAVDD